MTHPRHHKAAHDAAGPGQGEGGRGLPPELQEYFCRGFHAEREPGWQERYRAEIEERRRSGPRVVRKR